jgi:septal ring factor EnvC (AmiA/AmiB activator)
LVISRLYGYRFNFTCFYKKTKIEIREVTIIYCKSKSKFNRESRRSLEKELKDLSSHRDCLDITDESVDKRINDIEKELEQIYNQKVKRTLLFTLS